MRSSIELFNALAIASVGLLGCMPTDVSGDMPPIGVEGDCAVISGELRITSVAATAELPTKCFTVTGTLKILNTDLTDLEPLSLLREANSLEIIGNQQLQNTSGLDYVKVNQDLKIENNAVLTEILGFEGTQTLGGLSIRENPRLSSIHGIRALTKVGTSGFTFSGNGGPQDLSELNSLESAGKVIIENNTGMSSLKFDVKTVTGNIDISDNRDMTRLDSFGSLETLSGSLNIERNTSLTILSGFTKIRVIGGSLAVIGNVALSDAYDLSISLDTVGGSIVVIGNNALSDCRAAEFEDIESGSLPDIGDNGPFDPCY